MRKRRFWMSIKLPPDFFETVEIGTKYVVYGDTDSLYINIPFIKPESIQESIEISKEVSESINKLIAEYLNSYFLPRCGVSKEYNYTDFKTEIIASAMLLLDVKKNYAYKMVAKEGVVLDKPKIKYVGIPVVRSDYSDLTKDIIKTIIETLMDNTDISVISNKIREFKEKMDEDIANYEFDYIGIPVKWNIREYVKDTAQIMAMKLYNTIMVEDTFKPMASGKRVPITIQKISKLNQHINTISDKNLKFVLTPETDITKINFLAIPTTENYDRDKLKNAMTNFGISVDTNKLWSTSFSKTCMRIIELAKKRR